MKITAFGWLQFVLHFQTSEGLDFKKRHLLFENLPTYTHSHRIIVNKKLTLTVADY